MNPTLTVLSLGAGIQSTTLLLRSIRGDEGFPKFDAAIFADTGWEPQPVYAHLQRLTDFCQQHDQPLHVVRYTPDPNNEKQHMRSQIPMFTTTDGETEGRSQRQCTNNYKSIPVRNKIRELLGLEPGQRTPDDVLVHQAIGFSSDESRRIRLSKDWWIKLIYPLIDLGISRTGCVNWLRENWPHPVPRSACYICPYRRDPEWRALKEYSPQDFKRAVEFDNELRKNPPIGLPSTAYLHRSLQPLKDVPLDNSEDHGQATLFGTECIGECWT